MLTCQFCHTENRADAIYCNHCGASLNPGAAPSTASAAGAAKIPNNATGRLPLQSQLRGRFEITQLVGQGGMAAVYKATNLRTKAVVAIKEMSQDGLTPTELRESLESFRFEAVTLQRLRHANLPRVYESFSENTRHYLVMDYIEGKTLEQYQQARGNGPLAEADVLRWASQIASVLGYLHSQRPPIIFRDLKPSNIMLTTDGQIKLIDFGIARVFAPGRSRDTQVLGTPGFAPPEQYGKAQTDARADVYAFGCTLYQLLTGYDPGTTPFNLPPMQSRNPKISSQVQRAIERATKLDRDQRYPNVDVFVRDLLLGSSSGQTTQQAAPKTSTAQRTAGPQPAPKRPAASAATNATHTNTNNARTGTRAGAAAHVAAPTMAAIVVVRPHTIDFGPIIFGQRGTQSFTISGQNNMPVRGQIKVLSSWLSLDRTSFDGPNTVVQLTAETSKLPKPGKQVSTLQINCDRQHLYVPVTINILPAPAPVTKVVPAIGATGRKAPPTQKSAATKAPSLSKYQMASLKASRRRPWLRFALSATLALAVAGGFFALAQQLLKPHMLPFPLTPTLPVVLGALLLSMLLATGVAIIGSGIQGWPGRLRTTFFGAATLAALLIVFVGPYPWAGFQVILHYPVKIPSTLLLLLPLALGLGAALGAEPLVSRSMMAIGRFFGRNVQLVMGIAGAIAAGWACHAVAWSGAGSGLISCVTIIGALLGFVLLFNISSPLRRLSRARP